MNSSTHASKVGTCSFICYVDPATGERVDVADGRSKQTLVRAICKFTPRDRTATFQCSMDNGKLYIDAMAGDLVWHAANQTTPRSSGRRSRALISLVMPIFRATSTRQLLLPQTWTKSTTTPCTSSATGLLAAMTPLSRRIAAST